jgi:uncharacterized protein YndB with AHSA1/START domain
MINSEGTQGPAIKLVSTFRAPRDKVFRTWTDPELIKKWFFAQEGYRTTVAEIELQPLGAWKLRVESDEHPDDPTIIYGNFLEVRRGELLTYSWTGACAGEQYWTLVTVRFSDDGPGSRIDLAHGVFHDEQDRTLHEQGWFGCIEPFGRLVES